MPGAVYKTGTPGCLVLKTSEGDRGNFRFVAGIYTENLYWIFSRNVQIFCKCSSVIINLGPSLWFAVEIVPVIGCRHQVEVVCVGDVSVKYVDFKHRIKEGNMFLRNFDNTARFHTAPNTQQSDKHPYFSRIACILRTIVVCVCVCVCACVRACYMRTVQKSRVCLFR